MQNNTLATWEHDSASPALQPKQCAEITVPSLLAISQTERETLRSLFENVSPWQSLVWWCSGTRVPPFFKSCMRRGFLLMRASFVMLLTMRSDARARKGVSFYLSACRFPVFLYTNCTSVYLV